MSVSRDAMLRLGELMRRTNGVMLGEDKAYLVELRLAPLADIRGSRSIDELIARATADPVLAKEVTDAMTTGETSFFRDLDPFDSLGTIVIPELARRAAGGTVHIWCAACSTGQEPYSVAMLLAEAGMLDGRVLITATDVSARAIERARAGVFGPYEVNRGLAATRLVRYFDAVDGGFRVSEAIRAAVRFREHNLLDAWDDVGPVDLLLLRNVLIYFSVDHKRAVLERAASVLRSDGLLLLGGAETTYGLSDRFEPVRLGGAMYFRLVGSRWP